MRTILKISWRSIWRNRRRTIISMSAVCIGTVLIIFYGGLMNGVVGEAKSQLDNTGMGHVEITAPDWRLKRDVGLGVAAPESLVERLSLPPQMEVGWRLVSRGLAGSARGSEGVEIHGVVWDREADLSVHARDIRHGDRPADDDLGGILIGQRLADSLQVDVGGRVRLMVQDADGELGANLYRVRGIFHSPSPSISQRRVLMSEKAARELLGVGDVASQVVIQLDDASLAEPIAERLRGELGADYEVLTYGDLLPALRDLEEFYASVVWFAAIFVYLLVGLGIFNTMLMSVLERTREFGVLRAIGTRPGRVVAQVLGESFWIGTISGAVGLTVGLSITWYGSQHVILDYSSALGEAYEYAGTVISSAMKTHFSVRDGLIAAGLVYVMALFTGLFPAWRVARMPPATALHSK